MGGVLAQAPLALQAEGEHVAAMAVDLTPTLEMLRREIPSLAGVYLFGSQAAGAARPESDVDLALYAGRPVDREALLNLQHKAAKLLLRDVDLIDLAVADTILQMQAIGEGRIVDAPDPDSLGLFEVRVMRAYQQLKERRAGIEADIVERGRVHA